MDPVNVIYSLDMLGGDPQGIAGTVAAVPDTEALARFQQSMQGGEWPVDAVAKDGPVQLGGVDSSGTMGDKILEGLHGLKSGMDTQMSAMESSLAEPDKLSTADLMSVQFDLIKFSMQAELMGKTVSKGTQNLDTLLKSQ